MRSSSSRRCARIAVQAVAITLCTPAVVLACPDCATGRLARAAVFDAGFIWDMLLVGSPVFVLGAVATFAHRVDPAHPLATGSRTRLGPLVAAGLLLGAGLGGFADGIVLHQILQWHNMLSSKVVPVDLVSMKHNMVWDGLFHAFTWCTTIAGLTLLFRAGRRVDVPWSGRALVGAFAVGWGLFNVIEGVIDHHILGLHHVRPGADQLAWDIGFLVLGALLIAGGAALIRRASGERASSEKSP